MKTIQVLAVIGAALIGLAAPASSQTPDLAVAPTGASPLPMSRASALTAAQRSTIAKDIAAKWQSAADKRPGGGGARWLKILTKIVMEADADNVLKATSARSLDEVHISLTGGDITAPVPSGKSANSVGNGSVSPQTLGSYSDDLVYTPLPNGRCRIADSRVINSPLVGKRDLYIEEMLDYLGQGGSGTYANGTGSANCGINFLTTAYAISVTLLAPTGSGAFKVFPYQQPHQTGNSVWMNAGSSGASADLIVRTCLGCVYDIGVYSSSSVHYVIDVIGYYMPPQATTLQCHDTGQAVVFVGEGESSSVDAPACPVGTDSVGIQCLGSAMSLILSPFQNTCFIYNNVAAPVSVGAISRCCKVPGR